MSSTAPAADKVPTPADIDKSYEAKFAEIDAKVKALEEKTKEIDAKAAAIDQKVKEMFPE